MSQTLLVLPSLKLFLRQLRASKLLLEFINSYAIFNRVECKHVTIDLDSSELWMRIIDPLVDLLAVRASIGRDDEKRVIRTLHPRGSEIVVSEDARLQFLRALPLQERILIFKLYSLGWQTIEIGDQLEDLLFLDCFFSLNVLLTQDMHLKGWVHNLSMQRDRRLVQFTPLKSAQMSPDLVTASFAS